MDRRVIRVRRRVQAGLIAAGLSLAAVIAFAVLVSTALVRASPSWWRQYRATPELADRGAAVENAAVSHLYRQRPADPAWAARPEGPWRSEVWSIAIRDEDASAWLTARLPEWVEGQADLDGWPDRLGRPQVRFEPGLVRLGVHVETDSGPRVLSAEFRPDVRPDGSVWLRTRWVHVGRLPVPAGLVLGPAADRFRDSLPPEIAADPYLADLARILAGDIPLAEDPVMSLEDGRAIRLVGLRVTEGRVEIDLRTESNGSLAKN